MRQSTLYSASNEYVDAESSSDEEPNRPIITQHWKPTQNVSNNTNSSGIITLTPISPIVQTQQELRDILRQRIVACAQSLQEDRKYGVQSDLSFNTITHMFPDMNNDLARSITDIVQECLTTMEPSTKEFFDNVKEAYLKLEDPSFRTPLDNVLATKSIPNLRSAIISARSKQTELMNENNKLSECIFVMQAEIHKLSRPTAGFEELQNYALHVQKEYLNETVAIVSAVVLLDTLTRSVRLHWTISHVLFARLEDILSMIVHIKIRSHKFCKVLQ